MSKEFEAIVIGAGVSGLYALHKLRELGLSVQIVEAGSGVGGTWYWNRYPGARFDSESYTYQYSFSKDLIEEWNWSERFASQPEIEAYLQHVTNKFDLQRDIEFDTRVKSVMFDETEKMWTLTSEDGREFRARYVLAATGFMSAHRLPDIDGIEDFKGECAHTARWPKDSIDFAGKRVGVIGCGATAVQVIQTIAPKVGHLSLFQRTPNWCAPLVNAPIGDEEQRALKARAQEIFDICTSTFAGFIHEADVREAKEVSKKERWALYETLYERGGFALWLSNFKDFFMNKDVAAEVTEFLEEKIRARINDPAIADKLIPKDHLYGTKRPPGEKNYYDIFNQENVELVDLREGQIKSVNASGIETENGQHDLDVIIYATGFHSISGELMRMDIVGENGLSLLEKWSDGPKTNLGVQFAGFPNLFAIMGPHNPAAFCNATRCAESNVVWIANCIKHMRDNGYATIQANEDAEEVWTQRCYDSIKGFLIDEIKNSWFFGYQNPDSEKGKFLMFTEGVPAYRKVFAEVEKNGYEGFTLQ